MSKNNVNTKATQPESLEEVLGGKDSFVVKNKKAIMGGIAAILVVVFGFIAYTNLYSNPRNEAANNAIYPCQNLFAQSAWEQALKGDSTGTVVGFAKVASECSGTKAGNLANAYAAVCHYNLGQYDEAIKYAESFSAADDNSVSPAVVAALGNLYACKDNKEKAVELLAKAANSANDKTITPVCLLQMGQIYEAMGNNDKALECYQEIKDKHQESPLSQQMDKYIERLK